MNQKKMAEYAYQKVPFYNNLCDKPVTTWEDYPIVDKKMVLENKNSLFSPEYIGDLYSDRLQRVITSGSSGDCLEIYWKQRDAIRSLTSLWVKRKKYYGIVPCDRRCYFFTTKIEGGREIDVEQSEYGLGFCKTDLSPERLLEIYEKMNAFEPKWIIIQPSLLILFMQLVKKYSCKPISSLRYIEVTGERITHEWKKEVEKFFNCKVASQYGCYEVNSIAYECPFHNLHVMTENVYAEIVDDDQICVTSKHNRVMPFIRYKVGDRGRLCDDRSCSCGSMEPILELDMSRENDLIQNADGSVTHYDCFFGVIERINLMLEMAVLQFQIVQTDYEKFDVYMVVDDKEDIPEVQMLFKKLCDNNQIRGEFTFSFADYLYPSEKTGKLAWFCSTMKGV